jgi:ribosome biogenesis GTPase A
MHKARKALALAMHDSDMVIEMLDARTPGASSNPLLATLRGRLPSLRILNKADLADPEITGQWQRFYCDMANSSCLINGLDQPINKNQLLSACQKLIEKKSSALPEKFQALIIGIPNVGKSTLLNQIMTRKLAKTGNEPAVTRQQQTVRLNDVWYLVDTPGLLWPKLEDQQAAYRLASTGTIRNSAVDARDIAWFTAELLLRDFYPLLASRYKIDVRPADAEELLYVIARNRGAVGKQQRVDWNKVSELLLNDFRSGKLGRISLELPPDN